MEVGFGLVGDFFENEFDVNFIVVFVNDVDVG